MTADGPEGEAPGAPGPTARRVRLGRSAAVMAVGTTLSRITGLGRLVAAAYAVGITESRLADTYNIANTMPNVIYELVLGGVLTSVFIPVVVEQLRTKPHDEAWDSVSSLVTTALTVLVAMSLLAMLAAPAVMRLFTLRLSGPEAAEQQALATFFLRIFALQIAFYGYAAIAGGLLNAHNRFAVPAFTPILNNLVVIATFLVFAAVVEGTPTVRGVNGSLAESLLLAGGTTLGVAAYAAGNWPFVRRLPGRLRARFRFRDPAVRKLARLSTWTLGYVAVNQVAFGLVLVMANGVQGGPTAFFTAFAFFQLPYGIATVSIMTALVPTLAAHFVDRDDAAFRARTAGGLRAMALLMIPATVAYIVLSGPLIRTLLQHGVMTAQSSELVVAVLNLLVLGLLPFSAFLLLLRAFYARQDTRTPFAVNVAVNAAFVVAAVALFPAFDVRGIAAAHTVSYAVGAGLAAAVLGRRIGGLDWRRTTLETLRIAAAAAVAAAAMVGVLWGVDQLTGPGDLRSLAQLVVGAAAGGVGFLAAAKVVGVEELALLVQLLPRHRRAASVTARG